MGNTCSQPRKKKVEDGGNINGRSTIEEDSDEEALKDFYGTGLKFLPYNQRKAQLEEWLIEIQKHNLERLRKEMITDLHTFILNNLLLCVEFYENFDRAMESAKEFKKATENRMTDGLGELSEDGMILGERKITIIHGMGNELAQNYVYLDDGYKRKKDKNKMEPVEPMVNTFTYKSSEYDTTFTCDSILPLEFVVTWDNLEVYKESEWESLKEYQYASAGGSPSICRVCLEETDDKNLIPKGFVRLRVADCPLSLRPPHPIPPALPSPGSGYAEETYSIVGIDENEFKETVHEVGTDSDLSHTEGSNTDSNSEEESSDISINFMNSLRNRIKTSSTFEPKSSASILSSDLAPPNSTDENQRKLSGVMPQSFQQVVNELNKRRNSPTSSKSNQVSPSPQKTSHDSPIIPQDKKAVESELYKKYQSKVTTTDYPGTALQTPSSSALALRRQSRSVQISVPPPIPPPLPSQLVGKFAQTQKIVGQQPPSSGYDSMSPLPSRSRSSSVTTNDEIQTKWRQSELKRLGQFLPKTRRGELHPLSDLCFEKIQIEIESDEEIIEFETDSDSSSSTTTTHKTKPLSEPRYEDKAYLSSVGFSADFCSEFKQVGSKLGVNESTLQNAVVLGATIRCSVSDPPVLEPKDEYPKPSSSISHSAQSKMRKYGRNMEPWTILHTFTPSLQSKNWPQKPLIWWKEKMLRPTREDEKWPTAEQVDEIEESGCNIIPLGFRSVQSTQSENVQQTIVWKVGFAAAENILLNSLLHVQWRCLTFSCLLFRAFIAPLGPLGIDLEHFRNILYYMCHEEFISWNHEQPGLHLKVLLDKIYDCLGRGDMPSFFVAGQNILRNIPTQNLRKVQASLSRVRNNLLFHVLFMIRNLIQIKPNFYPIPKDNFRKLYEYLTVKHILYLVNPLLAGVTTEDLKQEAKNQKQRKRQQWKEINQALLMNGESIDTAYDDLLMKGPSKYRQIDSEQKKLRRKRERWLKKQEQIKEKQAEEVRIATEALKLPSEKKNSIDLEEMPVKQRKFSAQRLGLVLKYFIKHFFKMAAKSYEFKSFSQASMYTQHVENLISLLSELPNEGDSKEMEKFQEDSKILRDTIGIHMLDYIQDKMGRKPEINTRNTDKLDEITGLLLKSGDITGSTSNWELKKMPTIPNDKLGRTTTFEQINANSRNHALGNEASSSGTVYRIPRITAGQFRKGPGIKWNSNPSLPILPQPMDNTENSNNARLVLN